MKVSDILSDKGRNVWTVEPKLMVYDAMKLMADKGIGALIVAEGERVVGIISERDYARKVILEGRSSRTTAVRQIMTSHVLYAGLSQTIEECMAIMTDKRIRHLPVLDEGRLIGVISIGDLVKAIISEQQFRIAQLEKYISG
jgi:CBS domain-containing protein